MFDYQNEFTGGDALEKVVQKDHSMYGEEEETKN